MSAVDEERAIIQEVIGGFTDAERQQLLEMFVTSGMHIEIGKDFEPELHTAGCGCCVFSRDLEDIEEEDEDDEFSTRPHPLIVSLLRSAKAASPRVD